MGKEEDKIPNNVSTESEEVDGEVGDDVREAEGQCRTSTTSSVSSSIPFDRLTPRSSSLKREVIDPALSTAVSRGGRREYAKLRRLLPKLQSRDSVSRVEIIEETIRYIDHLHDQLAHRRQARLEGEEEAKRRDGGEGEQGEEVVGAQWEEEERQVEGDRQSQAHHTPP